MFCYMSFPLGKLSFRNGALKILAEKNDPLYVSEIIKSLIDRKLIKTNGKTPAGTLSAALNKLIKEDYGIYKNYKLVKIKKGLFKASYLK